MPLNYNKNNIQSAKALRKNATPQENHLWYDFLRQYEVRFQRQKAIGNYIVDFYCFRAKLVVEVDGSQHFTDEEMTLLRLLRKYGKVTEMHKGNDGMAGVGLSGSYGLSFTIADRLLKPGENIDLDELFKEDEDVD